MECLQTSLKDAKIIKPDIFGDDRGFFLESWHQKRFDELLNHTQPLTFVQDNHSRSSKGVLRGLHYQLPRPQGKLVRVVLGHIYDVIVDLRLDSPTFGQHEGFHLTADNKQLLWVPPGFAHGFITLSDYAEMFYKCTEYYHPEYEVSLLWNDVDLKIDWPIDSQITPLLSKKDQLGFSLKDAPKFHSL